MSLTPSAPLFPPHPMALGKYEVLCRLSMGGMSEIFLAYQRGIGGFRKIVALKTILPDTRGREDIVRMFLNEARVTAEFSHPNVVQVYDLGIDNDMLYLAMEYVQGCNMVEMVRACHAAQQTIPMGFTLATVRDTALALSYAHTFVDMRHRKRPVVHRDVAGKNIMVTYEGTTKLLDFGIAKMNNTHSHTFAGTVKGTTGYMSPEQLLGQPLDGRSDIFSLGIVIHECLTGYRLFHETSPEKKKTAVLKGDIHLPSAINPAIPTALDAVIMKALERNPENRFQSALEFARALEEAAGEHIWRPEQVGQLVVAHFSKRREQTRELIEEVQARLNEVTGQIRIEDFLGPCGEAVAGAEDFEDEGDFQKEKTQMLPSLSPQEADGLDEELLTPNMPLEKDAFSETSITSPAQPCVLAEGTTNTPPTSMHAEPSALIPIPMPSTPTTPPGADTQPPPSHETLTYFQRFLANRMLVLASVSVLLGLFLAVVLFGVFTGFNPSN